MCGRRADDEDRLACERELPHRMIDLFGDLLRPRALVEPRQLVERQPHLAIIGVEWLHWPWPGKHDQRCVGPARPGHGNILRELSAEAVHVAGIKEQIAPLSL